jgi:uncharacterized protein (DUF58 family)
MAAILAASEIVLGRRQLYMLPTGHGVLLAALLFVMLLVAVNYGNALTYALTFLLAAIAIVSMLYTQRNLLGLRITPGPCTPVFAGDRASFPLHLQSTRGLRRWQISVQHGKKPIACIDVRTGTDGIARLELPSVRRGYLEAPAIVLSTRFPLGFFYAWSRQIRLEQRCLVYPQPAPASTLAAAFDAHGWRDAASGQREGEDFVGLREFRHGDSPRHISWKAVARGRGLLAKQFGGGYRTSVWLEYDKLAGLDAEQRLSELCAAVLQCEQAGLQYGLRLPGQTLVPAAGLQHQHHCLAALALFQS